MCKDSEYDRLSEGTEYTRAMRTARNLLALSFHEVCIGKAASSVFHQLQDGERSVANWETEKLKLASPLLMMLAYSRLSLTCITGETQDREAYYANKCRQEGCSAWNKYDTELQIARTQFWRALLPEQIFEWMSSYSEVTDVQTAVFETVHQTLNDLEREFDGDGKRQAEIQQHVGEPSFQDALCRIPQVNCIQLLLKLEEKAAAGFSSASNEMERQRKFISVKY